MIPIQTEDDVTAIAKRWKSKRGSLIMALHALQDRYGYVPREAAMNLGEQMDVPLARIYEVLTFYNYFRLESPGKHVVSVCMGTACYLKGAPTCSKTPPRGWGSGPARPRQMANTTSRWSGAWAAADSLPLLPSTPSCCPR